MRSIIPCSVSTLSLHNLHPCNKETYLGHNGLASLIGDIAERHLCAFVLADLNLRMVNVGDLVYRHCPQSAHCCHFQTLSLG